MDLRTRNSKWSWVMSRYECLNLWRNESVVVLFKIPLTNGLCVFRMETFMNLYSLCLILTCTPKVYLKSILPSVGLCSTVKWFLLTPFYHHHRLLCIKARLHEFIVHQKLKNFTYGLIYKVNTSLS